MIAAATPNQTRQVELILRQVDSLPTLPAVATRLLRLTASDDSHAREVIELVRNDQALTGKVLGICAQAHRGVRTATLTIDKAVMLLGFNAVRNAVLSMQVVQVLGSIEAREADGRINEARGSRNNPHRFNRIDFWRHCLAVASAAELIAIANPRSGLNGGEAFVCGLLHDIGKLALDHVMPQSYSRVLEMADLNQGDIAVHERRVVGLDHHTVGKRLAEHWRLPTLIQDCIWLHGAGYQTLPNLEKRKMIGLITLADLMARQQHIGFSGNTSFDQNPEDLAAVIDVRPETLQQVVSRLHEQVQQRSSLLGLDEEASEGLLLDSIQQANRTLGRLNQVMVRRTQQSETQSRVIEAIAQFHKQLAPSTSVQDVLDAVVKSAMHILGEGVYAVLYQGAGEDDEGEAAPWLLCQYSAQGRLDRSRWIDPPPHTPRLTDIESDQPLSMNLMGLLPWVADHMGEARNVYSIKLLPLSCHDSASAMLLHDRSSLPGEPHLHALLGAWAAAVTSSARAEDAQRLGEELAHVNRALAMTQQELLKAETLSRLGEMAAGAAHEMNNPLAVIAGRSQMLAKSLPPGGEQHEASQAISQQAHRLSDLITGLNMFANPPEPKRRTVDIASLLDETVRSVRARLNRREADVGVNLQIKSDLPSVRLDPQQIADALKELVLNAVQSHPKHSVTVAAKLDSSRQYLLVEVIDDGVGMDSRTLSHATDPFFSAKSAGRRVGMGLTRARQLIELHKGRLEIHSQKDQGATAKVWLPLEPEVSS